MVRKSCCRADGRWKLKDFFFLISNDEIWNTVESGSHIKEIESIGRIFAFSSKIASSDHIGHWNSYRN